MRIGLIGCGNVGRSMHLPGYKFLDGVEVVALCDIDKHNLDKAGDRFGVEHRYLDAREMMRCEELDIVTVAVPPAFHAECCVIAMEGGAHVLVEKPFVECAADADLVMATALKTGKKVCVSQNYRYLWVSQAIKESIVRGDIGNPYHISFWQYLNSDPAQWPEWKRNMDMPHLLEFGVHVCDFLRYMFSADPVSVYARMRRFDWAPHGDSADQIIVDFGNGRAATIIMNQASAGAVEWLECRIDGEKGSIRSSFVSSVSVDTQTTSTRVGTPDADSAFERSAARSMGQLVEAIKSGTEPPTPPQDNLKSLAIVWGAYESARTGEVVRF